MATQLDTMLQKPQGSWIFCGPSTGLRGAAAADLSYVLHGHAQSQADCKICSKLASGTHPDVVTIMPSDKGSIGIDAVKSLQHTLALSRHDQGMPYRLMIIEDADKLTIQAQNALLRLLEEPPADAIIILLTSDESKLLGTVRSRCRTLYFPETSMQVEAPNSARDTMMDEILAADQFTQLAMAGQIDQKFDAAAFRTALGQRLRASLRQAETTQALVAAVRQLDALERFERNASSNVPPKTALTAYLLEAM
jgi:DNA polymerase III delta prime subunit